MTFEDFNQCQLHDMKLNDWTKQIVHDMEQLSVQDRKAVTNVLIKEGLLPGVSFDQPNYPNKPCPVDLQDEQFATKMKILKQQELEKEKILAYEKYYNTYTPY